MKIRLLLLFLLLLGSGKFWQAKAQREATNWFFGNQASLEFSSPIPSSFYNSAMVAPEGSATISDKNGNLLFYTNGETIWNRLHQPMANGTGLLGNISATQSSLIVPKPGNDSLFYLFTSDATIGGNSANGIRYSIVNINANNGLGEVQPGSKNISLTGSGPFSEKLAGIHHFNNQDVWVITHRFPGPGTQEFLAYKITASGITTTPVISTMAALPVVVGGGYLKAAPTGNKLAACFTDEGLQMFDFDNKTGLVSNPETLWQLSRPGLNTFYGAEFSPDGQKLYLSFKANSNTSYIRQYNLAAGSLTNIINTTTNIAALSTPNGSGSMMAMQVAANGKIYVTRSNTRQLSEIASPDLVGFACNFKAAAVLPTNDLATGTTNAAGFPNFIQSYFAPPRFDFTGICAESPTVFYLVNPAGVDSVHWDFGDPGTISPNTSTQMQASHTYYLPGVYFVKLTIYVQGLASVFERQVTILNKPLVNLGKDTTICDGQSYNLASSFPHSPFNERFKWSTGDTVAAIVVSKPGIYWLELSNGQCTTRDSIRIYSKPPPTVDLGPDFFTCGSATITMDAGNPGATYLWQPGGETTQTITVNSTGAYKVIVTVNGCSASDTKNVTMLDMPGMDLGNDITTCEGEIVTLSTGAGENQYISYLWSDSTSGPELKVTKSGKYWATISRGGCSYTDTIHVKFNYCPPVPQPFIPNIITPNGDNLNDRLVGKNLPEGAWSLKVFNRWGIQVFEKKDYHNEWPDTNISHGTYFYILEHGKTGKQFKGWVEVVE